MLISISNISQSVFTDQLDYGSSLCRSCLHAILGSRLRGEMRQFDVPEAHHFLASLIPEREVDAAQTFAQSQAPNCPQFGIVAHHLSEAIEGDFAAQMMNVVQANIA